MIIQKNNDLNQIYTSIVNMSKDDYDNLFKPGGRLFPLDFNELKPIKSYERNNKSIVCVPSQKYINNIPGYSRSHFTIEKKIKKSSLLL